MRAGQLRHKVIVQSLSVGATDSEGAPLEEYYNLATRWAAIDFPQGQELFVAQQRYGEVTVRIRMRHLAGLKPSARIVRDTEEGEQVFDVKAVLNPDGRNRETVIWATETV